MRGLNSTSAWAIVGGYIAGVALWLIATAVIVSTFVQDPDTTAQIGLASTAVIVIASVLVMLRLADRARSATPAPGTPTPRRTIRLQWSVTLLAPIVIVGLVVALEVPWLRRDALRSLEAIADLKQQQITSWLEEREADLDTLLRDPGFVRQIAALAEDPDARPDAALSGRLRALVEAYAYTAIEVYAPDGRVLLTIGSPDITGLPADDVRRHAGEDERPHFEFSSAGSSLHLGRALPLGDDPAAPAAVVALFIPTDAFLYPYLRANVDDSRTGEALLVDDSGGEVRFITPLRHAAHRPGSFFEPIESPQLPAAVALRTQASGTLVGRDYRDAVVYAAYRPVPGTNWRLIVKRDRREVLEPLVVLAGWVGLVCLLAIAVISVLLVRVHRLAIAAERQRADRQMQQFFELPFVGVAITDPDTKRWVRYNDTLADILGYTPAELAELSWADVTHPDDLAKDVAEFERVLRGESDGYAMDKRYLRKDGRVVDAYIDVKVIRDERGEVSHFLALVQDIGERKRAERELAEARQLLEFAIEQLPIPVMIARPPDLALSQINAAAKALMVRPDDDITAVPPARWRDYWPALQADGSTPLALDDWPLARAIRHGERTENLELVIRHPDGDHWVSASAAPLLNGDGQCIAGIVAFPDITAHKQFEREIERLSRLYATLSQTNQAIVRCDDATELFESICRNVAGVGEYPLAWIGLTDDSGRVEPVASAGEARAYLDTVEIWADPDHPGGGGPTGIAIRSGEPYWCQDFQADPATQPWREPARAAGLASSAALPLRRGGRIIGALNIYSQHVQAFDAPAQDLLREMAADIAFALDTLDAHAALGRAEERLRLIIEASRDAPWDWDLQSGEFWYSPQVWKSLGHPVDAFPSTRDSWRQFVHPDDLDGVNTALDAVTSGRCEWQSVECRARHRDGHDIPVLIRALGSRDAAGTVTRVSGTVMNLSAMKKIEVTLRTQRDDLLRAKQLLDAHLNSSPLGVVEWDSDFRVRRWSPQAEAIFGWREDEVRGKRPDEFLFVHDEDADQVATVMRTLIDGTEPRIQTVNRNYTRDGRSVVVQWYSSALHGPDGQLLSVLSLTQDITRQREAEDALRRREALLDQVFEILPIGLWVADRDGKLVRGNPAGVAIWGGEPHVAPAEYGVFKARRLPSGEPIEADDWALTHTIRDGETITDELLEIDAFDGQTRTILNYTAPVTDDAGAIDGAVVVNLDVTERERSRRQMQEQLDELNRWYAATLGREERVLQLKSEVNTLLARLDEPPRYASADSPDADE